MKKRGCVPIEEGYRLRTSGVLDKMIFENAADALIWFAQPSVLINKYQYRLEMVTFLRRSCCKKEFRVTVVREFDNIDVAIAHLQHATGDLK